MPQAAGMYYFSSGEDDWSRPAVILLHGAGGNHLHWPPEIRRLAGQRIYAPDLPGHGKSDGIGRLQRQPIVEPQLRHDICGEEILAHVRQVDAVGRSNRLYFAVDSGTESEISLRVGHEFPG